MTTMLYFTNLISIAYPKSDKQAREIRIFKMRLRKQNKITSDVYWTWLGLRRI